ncbi:MAG: lipoprotein insertase outer membrane protein LolB [Pseudomonadota bacterium]
MSTARFSIAGVLTLLLLAGCATRPADRPATAPETAYEARELRLAQWTEWQLTGRLGLSQGDEGGSGRLDWSQQSDSADLRFRGTLGQGAWHLYAATDGARLELADGQVREADQVEQLVNEATGWSVPVTALGWWVRGVAWPSGTAPTQLDLNDDGTPSRLDQAGWEVRYTRYGQGPGDLVLPTRLEAVRDGLVVKLAISRWGGMAPEASDEG